MENASKALIIAGAILISILIVGLGVIIYNNVSGIAQSGTLDAQEITAHNSPFEGYMGEHVSGSNVRALLAQVTANNNAAAANGEEVGNYIFLSSSKDSYSKLDTGSIKTGKTYKVELSNENHTDKVNGTDASDTAWASGDNASYWTNGFIKMITITEVTNN